MSVFLDVEIDYLYKNLYTYCVSFEVRFAIIIWKTNFFLRSKPPFTKTATIQARYTHTTYLIRALPSKPAAQAVRSMFQSLVAITLSNKAIKRSSSNYTTLSSGGEPLAGPRRKCL